jgi:uncharacterized protein YdhG (YjbR/CyaY superfamily)
MPAKKADRGFTDEERAAMRERAKELRERSRGGKTDGEGAVRAAIAKMPEPYRSMGQDLHEIIMASAPTLAPKTWYGMPAYAREGEVVCFFRGGDKFKERYMTLGFNDSAKLDDGRMWPVAFALTALAGPDKARISEIVKKAVS